MQPGVALVFKFIEYIEQIDKKQNPLKSIAENGSSLLQCNWIVCTTSELVCEGGNKVSKHHVKTSHNNNMVIII